MGKFLVIIEVAVGILGTRDP
jgi:hypothetical protein